MRRGELLGAVLGPIVLGLPISCCVCADTPIRTPQGLRRLGDLRVGDEVLGCLVTTVERSGELVVRKIVARRTARRECLRLVHGAGELVCTPDHPLYSPETGEYEPAARWVGGTRRDLLLGDGGHVTRVLVAEAFVGVREVVDITLDETPHNFIAGGVVVHNKSFITDCEGQIDGPGFELTPDAIQRRFAIRACILGQEPSAAEFGSSMQISVTTEARDMPGAGQMRYAVYLEGEGDPEVVDQPAGYQIGVNIENISGMCATTRTIVFERLDGLTEGTIVVTWEIGAQSEPPKGASIDDPIDIEVRE